MKRIFLAVTLVFFTLFSAYGQNSAPIDLILLLDTSSNMGSSYQTVSNYVTGRFLSDYLRIGDTFHLIAFSDTPRFDAARRIQSRGDVETIIGRMLLQYPFESAGNIRTAINYAEDYAASLPSRPKKIVLVSTGGGDSDNLVSAAKQRLSSRNISLDFVQVNPGQPLSNLPSSGRTATATPSSSTATQGVSTTQQPSATPSTSQGSTSTSPSQGSASSTPSSQGQTPSSSTQTNPSAGTQTTTPSTVTSTGTGTSETSTSTTGQTQTQQSTTGTTSTSTGSSTGATAASETDQPRQDSSSPTSTGVSGSDTGVAESETASGTPVTSTESKTSSESSSRLDGTFSVPLIIGLILLALLVLGLIIFFSSRNLRSSPNRVMAQAAETEPNKTNKPNKTNTASTKKTTKTTNEEAPFTDHSKHLASYAAGQNRQRSTPYSDRSVKKDAYTPAVINPTGPLLLNLFVEDQNTAIGKRNIHSLKSGYSLKVGGSKSDDFYIFLVPMPGNIGEIRRNGAQCTFVPSKPKYFPDIGSNEVRDCVNKTIRIVSDKNYEVRFRFEMYEDPLEALNRILHSVKVPG